MGNPQMLESETTLLITQIQNIFEEWIPCETDNHEASPYHGGPESGGEWYVTKECPDCQTGSTLLICNEYTELIREYLRDGALVSCMVCGCSGRMSEFFQTPVSRKPLD